MAGSRALSTLLAPLSGVIKTLTDAGYTGIGTGPGQLAPPGPDYALVLSPGNTDVSFKYVDPRSFTEGSLLQWAAKTLGYIFSPETAAVKVGTQALQPEQRLLESEPLTLLQNQGGTRMAFSDGDSGFSFDGFFGGINQALQGGVGQSLLGLGTQALSGYLTQQFAPQPVSYGMGAPGPMAQPVMASVPALGRAASVVGRGFFNRFPNLATSLQALRNRGANVSRASMYSALKRFGPEMLVSGGILTAAAVSELAVAGAGRRRMNPGNVKALRKAHRRMKSFHKVCVDNDQLLKRGRRK